MPLKELLNERLTHSMVNNKSTSIAWVSRLTSSNTINER